MESSPREPSLGGKSDNYELWDAAYVLGSLSEVDRRAYEAHLGDCRSCRQSVDQLSGMPRALLMNSEMAPALGSSSPTTRLTVVLLPDPFGPR